MTDFQDYMNTHKIYPDDISRRIDIPPGFDSFRDTATDGKPHPDNGIPTVKESLTTALDENGLVRCGCGGEAVLSVSQESADRCGVCFIRCRKCDISTTFYNTGGDARDAWNLAMGYHE